MTKTGKKHHTLKQIYGILRVIDAQVDRGETAEQACTEQDISPATYYLWRKNYGQMTPYQLSRIEKSDEAMAQLKNRVRQLSLDNEILREAMRVAGPLPPDRKRQVIAAIQERLNIPERRIRTALAQP